MPAYVAGSENRLAAHALECLLSCATVGSIPQFLPSVVALFGRSGVGKTHLAHGLVRCWQSHQGERRAHYVTANDFRRAFHDSIRRETPDGFRQQFRKLRLLAIDDLHHLPNEPYLMQELRYTIDAYEDNGAVLVITATRPPSTLSNLPSDIRSRLAGGLLLHLAAPGRAARFELIRQATTALGYSLSDATIEHLAVGLGGTAPDLFAALFALFANPGNNQQVDRTRIEQFLAIRATRQPTIREILARVAKHCGVPQKQIRSSSRKQAVVFARGLVSFLARTTARASYEQIGQALGDRNHTTIMHGYQKMQIAYQSDPHIREMIDELRHELVSR